MKVKGWKNVHLGNIWQKPAGRAEVDFKAKPNKNKALRQVKEDSYYPEPAHWDSTCFHLCVAKKPHQKM